MIDATPERAQAVDFPKTPLLYYSLAVLARDDLPVKAWDDLNKPAVRIAVPQASSMDKFLTENVAKAQIQRFPGNAEAIAAFQAGRVDAVCLFHPPLLAARQKLGSRQDRRADAGAVAGVERRGAQGSRQVLGRVGRQGDRRVLRERPDAEVVRGVR